MWRNLAACVLWEHEVVGSNPTTPTNRRVSRVDASPFAPNVMEGLARLPQCELSTTLRAEHTPPGWRSVAP